MRNLILAIVCSLWGLLIVVGRLVGDGPQGDGAYGFGQNLAFVFGIVMLAAGVRALVKYFSARA